MKLQFIVEYKLHGMSILVTARSDTIKTVTDLRVALTKAVTEWMSETDEGLAAWQYAGNSFNINDLSVYMDNSLTPFLTRHNIVSLECVQLTQPSDWNFNTSLSEYNEPESGHPLQ